MTTEELKEIEERARKASSTFALDFMKREDFDYMNRGRSDVYKLLNYIKELEHEIEMLSASPDETSSHCGTFLEEREGGGMICPYCKRAWMMKVPSSPSLVCPRHYHICPKCGWTV